jgi:hypothetical protein
MSDLNSDTDPEGIPRPARIPKGTDMPPPALDPSPAVRIAKEVREGITDALGIMLSGYLAVRGTISGVHALGFVLLLLLPSPVLLRIAKILGNRGSGAAAMLVTLSVGYSKLKLALVAGLGTGAALSACGVIR